LATIEPSKQSSTRSASPGSSHKTLEYLLKPGNKDWSDEMEQMVIDKIQQSRTMYHLSSILD
jgi:hypothetical protein